MFWLLIALKKETQEQICEGIRILTKCINIYRRCLFLYSSCGFDAILCYSSSTSTVISTYISYCHMSNAGMHSHYHIIWPVPCDVDIIWASRQKQQRADRHQEDDRREKRFTCRSQDQCFGSPLKGCRHNSSDLCVPSLHILRELINKR